MNSREIRDAIEELQCAYIHCIDDDRLEEWPEFFTEANLYAPHYYLHLISAIRILGQERGAIIAQTNYTVFRTMADPIHYGETEIYSVGKYVDRIVFEQDKARFQEKIVIVDTCKIQSLLVTPL
jgi:anthranilate 1,2-dioxygenase small subunit